MGKSRSLLLVLGTLALLAVPILYLGYAYDFVFYRHYITLRRAFPDDIWIPAYITTVLLLLRRTRVTIAISVTVLVLVSILMFFWIAQA